MLSLIVEALNNKGHMARFAHTNCVMFSNATKTYNHKVSDMKL